MKNALIILILTLSFSSFAQDRDSIKFSILKKEVQWFIDTIKNGNLAPSKRIVYTVYMHDPFPDSNSICFALSYAYDYIYIDPPYFFELGNDFVIVNNPLSTAKKWIENNLIEIVDSAARIRIKNVVSKGIWIDHHGNSEILLCWYDGHRVYKRLCENTWGNEKAMDRNLRGKNNCSYDNFFQVKNSFYLDSIDEEKSKMKYRNLDE